MVFATCNNDAKLQKETENLVKIQECLCNICLILAGIYYILQQRVLYEQSIYDNRILEHENMLICTQRVSILKHLSSLNISR